MVLRSPAPDLEELQHKLDADSRRFVELIISPPLDDSRYWHWDQLRHRSPPEGLTHEEWWLKLKLQRSAQRREVPLEAKGGRPFFFVMSDEVLQLSEEIARRAGGNVLGGGNALTSAGRDGFIVRSLVEESITSSQLEGASTSRRAAVEMIDTGREPVDVSELMILNNYLAMKQVSARSGDPLSPDWVLELHADLTAGTLEDPGQAGRLERPEEERVRVWHGEHLVHTPPPAEQLPERLVRLCAFANGAVSSAPYIPPVVRATITHFMFGYDHYFADGNGRTARLAFYWSMLHNGYWLAEYLAISKILKEAPGQYGDSYEYSEDDDGDLTYFILHQLRVIVRALDELDAYIEMRRSEADRVRSALRGASVDFNTRQTSIIEWLSREGVVTVTANEISRRYGVTLPTARADLMRLEDAELLQRGPSKKPIVWKPAPGLSRRIADLGAPKEN